MKAVYIGIFEPQDNGHVYVSVPDLPNNVPDEPHWITSGVDMADAMKMADDALNEMLIVMEDERLPIPEPRPLSALEIPAGATPSMIVVDTDLKRRLDDVRAVRKNISVPAWMAARIDQMELNLSKFVQDSFRAQFGNA